MKTRIEKRKVCDQCFGIGMVQRDCVCTYTNYKVIELEFEFCDCCGHAVSDGSPIESEFNSAQLLKNGLTSTPGMKAINTTEDLDAYLRDEFPTWTLKIHGLADSQGDAMTPAEAWDYAVEDFWDDFLMSAQEDGYITLQIEKQEAIKWLDKTAAMQ